QAAIVGPTWLASYVSPTGEPAGRPAGSGRQMPPERALGRGAAAEPLARLEDDPGAEGALVPAAALWGRRGARVSPQLVLGLAGFVLATLAGAALVARRARHQAQAEERVLLRMRQAAAPERLLSLRPCVRDLEGTQIDRGFFAKIEGGCGGEGAADAEAAPPGVAFLGGNDSGALLSALGAEVAADRRWEVMAEEVNVRSAPSLDARSLGKKRRGEVFSGEMEGDWIRLKPSLGPGRFAYVKTMWEDIYLVSPAVADSRSHCANAGRNCSDSRCCRWPGHACFRKNAVWSACRSSCVEGPDPTDGDSGSWSCERLGEAAPGRPVDGELSRPVAGWVQDTCAAGSGSCSESRCCSAPGFQCYERTTLGTTLGAQSFAHNAMGLHAFVQHMWAKWAPLP
ncbi:unnamed protein product, partial [Prorocentrum cordatum]